MEPPFMFHTEDILIAAIEELEEAVKNYGTHRGLHRYNRIKSAYNYLDSILETRI